MTNPRIVAVGSPPTFRQQVAAALETSAETVPWMQNSQEAEAVLNLTGEQPDVLVVSPMISDDNAMALAKYANTHSPMTAVIVVRDEQVNGQMPSFIRAGVRDLVELDRGPTELRDALERAVDWSTSLKSARNDEHGDNSSDHGLMLTVFSSKGGTGKSFLATNLAAAIASHGNDTAIVDIDLAMGDVFSYYGTEPARPIQDLIALGDRATPEQVVSVGTKLADHLWGFGAPADVTAEGTSADSMNRALRAVKSTFDYTIVDVPAAYTDEVLGALDLSDFVVLISGLDVVGVKHLSKALETMIYIGVPRERLMVAMNRADSKVGLELEDVERLMKLKVDASLPSSRLVPASLNKGRPVFMEEPKAPVSQAVDAFARKLMAVTGQSASKAKPEGAKSKKSIFSRSR